MKFKGQTSTTAKAFAVYYGRDSLIPVSVDEAVSHSIYGYNVMLALDTENYGRLLYPVPVNLKLYPPHRIEIEQLHDFVLEANDLIYIKTIRLSVMKGGEYFHPLMLNGQKVIDTIALVKGARLCIQTSKERIIETTTHRIVLEMPTLGAS